MVIGETADLTVVGNQGLQIVDVIISEEEVVVIMVVHKVVFTSKEKVHPDEIRQNLMERCQLVLCADQFITGPKTVQIHTITL